MQNWGVLAFTVCLSWCAMVCSGIIMAYRDNHSLCSSETTKTVPLEESWVGEAGRKKEEEQHLLQFCMLSNVLQTAALCQARKQKSDECWSKLILSERAQKTLAQIKAHAKMLRSCSEKAAWWGKKEKRGSVLSCLIIHFRQLTTNYLPFSSICPSHDRKANVWRAHRWVGNSSLIYGKLPEFPPIS